MKYQTFFGYLTLSSILILIPVKLGLAQTSNEFQLAQNSDDFFQECFRNSKNQNQADMTRCAQLDYQQADKMLNQVYQQLRSQLSNTGKQLLTDAQLAWISFRDDECVFERNRGRGGGIMGSMGPGLQAACASDLTKKRTAELQAYVRGQISPPNNGNYQAVDRRLNQVYQQVRSSVGAQQQLQSAQIAWIEFRDASCRFENYHFSNNNNTCLTRLTEQRTEKLSRFMPGNRLPNSGGTTQTRTSQNPVNESKKLSQNGGRAQAQTSQDSVNQVKRLVQKGNQQLRKGQFKAALNTFQQALGIVRKISNSQSREGYILRRIARAYQYLYQYNNALENYRQALKIYQAVGEDGGVAWTLMRIGDIYRHQSQLEKAVEFYRQALEMSRKVGDRKTEGASLTGLGIFYDSQGQYKKALEYYQKSLRIDRERKDRISEGVVLNNIGVVYHRQGKYQQALDYYQEALRINREVGDRVKESLALNNIGEVYQSQGKYEQARNYYEQALKIRQNFDDPGREEETFNALVEIYSKIASIYRRQGQFPQALKYYQQVLEQQTQQQANDIELAETANSIGETYAEQGQYQTALEYYQQALKVFREKGDRKNEAITLNNIGLVYRRQGQYQQALDYYNQALAIFQQLGDREGEAKTLSNIAFVYYSQGKYQQALDYYNQALAVFEELGDRKLQATTLSNIGLVYEKLSQYQQALDYHQRALAIFEDLGDRSGINTAYNNIGLVYESLGDHEQALDYFQKSLGISREIGDKTGKAETLNNIGKTQENQGKTQQAQESYQQALEIYQQQENITGKAETLDNLSSVSRQQGDYEQAQTNSEQALEIYQQQEASIAEANNLNNLGELYASLNDLKQAIDLYERAFKIYEEQGDIQGQIDTLNNIRLANSSLGNDELAFANLEQMLELARDTGDRVMEAAILKQLARDYENRGDKKTAQKLREEAEKIEKDLDPDVVAAKAKTYELDNNVKQASRSPETNPTPSAEKPKTTTVEPKPVAEKSSEYEELLEKYESELAEKRKQKDKPGEAKALENIGSVHRRQRFYQDALDFYNQALEFQRQLGDRQKEAELLNNIGETYRTQRRDDLAQKYFEEALKIHQAEGDRAGEAATLNNLGLVYDSQGDDGQALEYFEQALEIFQEFGDRSGEATVLNNMGGVYARLARNETIEADKAELYDKALEFYQQALEIREEIGDRPGIGVTLNNIGDVYQSLGQFQLAKDYYQEAGVILAGTGNRESEAKSIGNLGALLLEEQKQPELAIILLKRSININESIRQDLQALPKELQETYAESIADRYRALAELLLRKDRPLEALRVIDLLKVQELEEYTRSVQGNEDTITGIEFLSLEQEIWEGYDQILQSANAVSSELNELSLISETKRTPVQQSRFSELEKQEQKFQQELNNYFQRNSVEQKVDTLAKKAKEQSLDLKYFDILQDQLGKLEQNGVLLYPLVLDDRIELIISTLKKAPQRLTVNVKLEELNQTVNEFSNTVSKTPSPSGKAEDPAILGQKLYNWLMKPIEKDLIDANVQTIIYAPDRQLRYIPLAALHDGKQWLIEGWRVNNITALSLTNLNKLPSQQPRVLAGAMSNSHTVQEDYLPENYEFDGLPNVKGEVEGIKSVIPNTKILINQDFTPTNTVPQMSKYQIVHFATHGKFVNGQPEYSFILFGNKEIETLRDMEKWELKDVELVVLSACETAFAHGYGVEILGLGYAIQKAGSRAAIATLWKVSDQSTETLMANFYNELIDKDITTAEALRQAQIELIKRKCEPGKKCNHPYYWAAFLLIGNGL